MAIDARVSAGTPAADAGGRDRNAPEARAGASRASAASGAVRRGARFARVRATRAILILLLLGIGGCAGYLGYTGLVLVPAGRKVIHEFVAHLEKRDCNAAYALFSEAFRAGKSQADWNVMFEGMDLYLTGIKDLSLSGFEVERLSALKLKGTVTYTAGPDGEVEFDLYRQPGGTFRIQAFRFQCPELLALQRKLAKDVALAFVGSLRKGSAGDAEKSMHAKLVEKVGRAKLESLAAKVKERVVDVTFDDSKSRNDDPTYQVFGTARFKAGSSGGVSIKVQRVAGRMCVTGFNFE
jgi:hypothetical protein